MTTRNRRRLRLERLERRDAPSVSPVGPEFRVNTVVAGTQNEAAVAMDADGDYVVVWTGVDDGTTAGVFAQRYSAAGTALGGEFLVNTFTAGGQSGAAVAANAAGDFVVVWESDGQDGSATGVYGQRFTAGGVRLGSEFHVSQATVNNQHFAAVACDAAGNFVVAWQSADGDSQGVFARRYDFTGVPFGNEFRVNSFTTGQQRRAAVAADGDGDFVVAWQSADQDGSGYGVYAQRFTAAGTATGGEFRVNDFTTNDQALPAVAMDVAGNFTVAWQSLNQAFPASANDIIAQRYNAAGATLGGNVNANVSSADTTAPVVARDGRGDSVIAYTFAVAGLFDVRVRSIAASGALTTEAVVNTYTTNIQTTPAIGAAAEGDFVVVWTGEGTGDTAGVFGQRYAESVEAVGPRVFALRSSGIADPVRPGDRLVAPPTGLVVEFTEDMSLAGGAAGANSVTNPANWVLTRNGTAVGIATITYGFNGATRRFEATLNLASSPLAAGAYTLTGAANLRDVAGNTIDGDGNGTGGDAFARAFTLAPPVAAGPETPVNQGTIGSQTSPNMASDAAGNFVVVWTDPGRDGDSSGVYARRFGATGAALGGDFRVNTFTTGSQTGADVAMDADGDFVVVWFSLNQDGSGSGIYGQRYSAAGVAQGAEFRVNQVTTGGQDQPKVAMNAAGDFVVVWESPDGGVDGIFARRFSAAGVALGGDIAVNVVTADVQQNPDVETDAHGNFVVAWTDNAQDGSGAGVYARRFDADGLPRGGEFLVNTFTTGNQIGPVLAMNAAGDFVVVWNSNSQDGSLLGVYARRYSAAGVAQTGEVAVNTTTTNSQFEQAVAMDADGDAVIVWSSDTGDGSGRGVFARRFDATGNPSTGEFQVNTFATGTQGAPRVAGGADGDFATAWLSDGQDGSAFGVFAQRYAAAAPPRVAGVAVNAGQANVTQRSRVTSLTVTFDSIVSFAGTVAAAFTVSRINGGAVGGFTASAATVGGVTVVTLGSFAGVETEFGSLADGRYTLVARVSQIANLDGNGDGTGGDDFTLAGSVANGLFRLFGDVNGDGSVSGGDFGTFRLAFGTVSTDAGYLAFLDFDGNGSISGGDFGNFRIRFGTSVP